MVSILINEAIIILINAVAVWLSIIVFFSNPKGKINRLFVLMAVFMLLWVDLANLGRIINPGEATLFSLLSIKIAWVVTPPFFFMLYLFTLLLIKEEKKYSLLSKITFLFAVISTLIIGCTDLVIKGIISDEFFSLVYGKGIVPFFAMIFFMVCATLYPLFKKYFSVLEEEKKKLNLFLIGIFTFYLANVIFNIFLPTLLNISRYYFLGDYSTIILLALIAYSVEKYEFLRVKVVLTEFLVVVMGLLLLVVPFLIDEVWLRVLLSVIFILFCIFGRLLIMSVIKEVRQKEILEIRVKERTLDLQSAQRDIHEKKEELDRFYKLTVGRELKMIELKQEIERLKNSMKK